MDKRATEHGGGGEGPATPSFESYGGSGPENYERYFVPAIGAPLATELVDLAALRPGERVVDVACGTGVVARLAAAEVGPTGAVIGVDANPGMLEVARTASDTGAAIEWLQGEAEAMPLPEASQDVALCQMGLQFFADKRAALEEIRRVLVPGGRLVANVPGPTPRIFSTLERALSRRLSQEVAKFVSAVFSLYEPDEIEQLLAGAGFDEVAVERRAESLRLPPPHEFLWQYVWSTPLAGALGKLDQADRASLEQDVISEWQASAEDGIMVLLLDVSLATATKP